MVDLINGRLRGTSNLVGWVFVLLLLFVFVFWEIKCLRCCVSGWAFKCPSSLPPPQQRSAQTSFLLKLYIYVLNDSFCQGKNCTPRIFFFSYFNFLKAFSFSALEKRPGAARWVRWRSPEHSTIHQHTPLCSPPASSSAAELIARFLGQLVLQHIYMQQAAPRQLSTCSCQSLLSF